MLSTKWFLQELADSSQQGYSFTMGYLADLFKHISFVPFLFFIFMTPF